MTIAEFNEKVKPCPFCGGREFEVTPEDFFHELEKKDGDNKACIKMECHKCRWLMMYEYTPEEHDYGKRLELLLAKWNKRRKAR